MTEARSIAIANQKGGVGKTTTTINLATALAAIGKAVLLVDLDAQGNASTGLGLAGHMRDLTSYDVLTRQASIKDAMLPTRVPNLSLLPASIDLAGIELELAAASDRSYRLKQALAAPDLPRFDYILVDCPPSLNVVTINAMTAADAVLVPLQCEFFALEGLSQLMRTIDLVRGSLNPKLALLGVVLTMFDSRNRLSDQVASDVRRHLGDTVYETVIPRNVRISEAPSHGKPALIYDHTCAGSQAYIKLASELLHRERKRIA
jgi:chromosome partitioning protein